MSANMTVVLRSKMTMSFENPAFMDDGVDLGCPCEAAAEPAPHSPKSSQPLQVQPQVAAGAVEAEVSPPVADEHNFCKQRCEGGAGSGSTTHFLPYSPESCNNLLEVMAVPSSVAHIPTISEMIEQEQNVACPPREEEKWRARKWSQYFAAFIASLSCMSIGYVDGWSAFAMPFFKSREPWQEQGKENHAHRASTATAFNLGAVPLRGISESQASWICSLVAVGGILGSIPAGIMADTFGRKSTLLLMTVPCLISWATVFFSSDTLGGLYSSRILAGFMMGVVSVVVPLYNEEIAEVSVRGKLGVYQDMLLTFGLLIAYLAGYLLPFSWSTLLPCVFPIIMLVLLPAMPETPFFLLKSGREEEAMCALSFLRGPWTDVARHALALRVQVGLVLRAEHELREQLQVEASRGGGAACTRAWTRLRLGVRRLTAHPLARVAFVLMLLRQLSGINVIAYYAVEIFGSEGFFSGQKCAVIIGVVEVASTFFSSMVVDRLGRRALLITSSIGMALAHLYLAFYFQLLSAGVAPDFLCLTPVSAVSGFMVAYALGFGPLPWLMMAELIPPEHKVWATALTGVVNWTSMFVILQFFGMLSSYAGIHFAFCIFPPFCVMAALYVHKFVPETSGQSPLQIQRSMISRSFPKLPNQQET